MSNQIAALKDHIVQSEQTLEKVHVPTLAIDELTDFLTLLAHVCEAVKK